MASVWVEFLKMFKQYASDEPVDESLPDWCLEDGGTHVPRYSEVAQLQEV